MIMIICEIVCIEESCERWELAHSSVLRSFSIGGFDNTGESDQRGTEHLAQIELLSKPLNAYL